MRRILIGGRRGSAVRTFVIVLAIALLAGLAGCGAASVADPVVEPTAEPDVDTVSTRTVEPTGGAVSDPDDGSGCAGQAAEFLERAAAAVAEWEEAEGAANSVDTADLGPAIERLADIRAAVGELDPPECALSVKVSLLRFMDLAIEYQNGIWGQECPLCMEELEVQASAAKARALDELAALAAGQ